MLGLAGGRTGSTAPLVLGLASVSRQGRVAGTIQPMKWRGRDAGVRSDNFTRTPESGSDNSAGNALAPTSEIDRDRRGVHQLVVVGNNQDQVLSESELRG
jgi:hypothetical protein